MQEKTPEALRCLQDHGLHLIALTAVAVGEADVAVTPLVSGRRHRRGGTIRLAIEAEDVRDSPLGCAVLRRAKYLDIFAMVL
jgi:hypothetical protein